MVSIAHIGVASAHSPNWHWGLATLVTALLPVLGCGSVSEPTHPIVELSLHVSTAEADADRYLLVVGDTGYASITAKRSAGCIFTDPCTASVDVEFLSSDGSVVAPAYQQLTTPATVIFTAKAPGSVEITAAAQGFVQSARVDVVAAPLPVDSVRIRSGLSSFDSAIAIVHDPGGNLASLTLAVRGYAALYISVFRDGPSVRLPLTIESSDSAVAWVSLHCRAQVVDPTCDITGTWVTGLAPGTAAVTVTARNRQRSFSVTVQ